MTRCPRRMSRWLLVRESYDWDWAGAESEFKRAIQLNPNNASGHQWYGDFLTRMARFDEARIELKKAQELDPLSLLTNTSLGRLLYFTRQYDDAAVQLTKTLDMDPKFVPAQHAIEAAYAQNGNFKEAIGERQKVLTLSGNPDLAAAIGEDFNTSGYPGVMKSWLEGSERSIQAGLRFVLQHRADLCPARETRARRWHRSKPLTTSATAISPTSRSNLHLTSFVPTPDSRRSCSSWRCRSWNVARLRPR